MKVVDRKTFISLPAGTIFCKGKPWIFGSLCIKGESLENDWYYYDPSWIDAFDFSEAFQRLEEMATSGASYPCQNSLTRDGYFDEEAIFLIYETADLMQIQDAIKNAIAISGG